MVKKVLIYSTATCAACKAAKDYLKNKGIAFDSLDVGEDENAREEMLKQNGGRLTVPTIVADGEVVVGFDKTKIDKLLL